MNKTHRRNWFSHSNLNDEVANVFLKLRYVLVEADQAFDEHFNLSTATAKPAHQKTTVLRPFFRDHPGEPVPEENFWTLWCRGRLTEADTDHPVGRHSICTNQCPPPPFPHYCTTVIIKTGQQWDAGSKACTVHTS